MIETADEFVRLRCSEKPELYLRSVNEPASEHVWKEVIEKYPEMRQWVAHNKTVPNSILAVLAGDSDPSVRHSVAMKRVLEFSLRERLASDPDDSVRLAIAMNKKTPLDVLRKLANDSWERITEVAKTEIDLRQRR